MSKKLSEEEICAELHKVITEGKKLRRLGGNNRYAGNSLYHMLTCVGWVYEDLRIALMKASPAYLVSQERFGQGLTHLEAERANAGKQT